MQGVVNIRFRRSGGRAVLSDSTTTGSGGIEVAGEDYPIRCLLPRNEHTLIAERHSTFRDYNVPAAFDGHRRKWGRRLVSLRPEAGAN